MAILVQDARREAARIKVPDVLVGDRLETHMPEQMKNDHDLVEPKDDLLELVSGGAGVQIDGNRRPAG